MVKNTLAKRALEEGYAWVLLRTTLEVGLVPWYRKHGFEERHTRQLTYADAPTVLDVIMSKRTTIPTAQPGTPAASRLRIVGTEEARRIAGGGSDPLIGFGVASYR